MQRREAGNFHLKKRSAISRSQIEFLNIMSLNNLTLYRTYVQVTTGKYNSPPDLSMAYVQIRTIPSGRRREQDPYVQKRAECPQKAA